MLKFRNSYSQTVWVALMRYDPACASIGVSVVDSGVHHYCNEPWSKSGGWKIVPGNSAVVYAESVKDLNRYYYFYAEAADGSVWGGDFTEDVTNSKFDLCSCFKAPSPSRQVGFREIDVKDNDNYTITLVE